MTTKAQATKARKAEADLERLKNDHGFVGSLHGSSGECFEVVYSSAEEGPVIAYMHHGTVILCRQVVDDNMLKKYAKAEALYEKYEEYL